MKTYNIERLMAAIGLAWSLERGTITIWGRGDKITFPTTSLKNAYRTATSFARKVRYVESTR